MSYEKILLTAFEPFDATGTNSSLEVLHCLALPWLKTAVLPVSYRRAAAELTRLIERERPDFIVCLGQAGGERSVRLENGASNFSRAAVSDNDCFLLRSCAVLPDGPDVIFT